MKRRESILGTYNSQKLPKVKIGEGHFIGNSLLPNLDFLKQMTNGGQNAFHKKSFELSTPEYRVDPILKFSPGGENEEPPRDIKELQEIVIVAPRRDKMKREEVTVRAPKNVAGRNYRKVGFEKPSSLSPILTTPLPNYFKNKQILPNTNTSTSFNVHKSLENRIPTSSSSNTYTPPVLFYQQNEPATLESLYKDNSSDNKDAYMDLIEQFDPERARMLKMMKEDAFNNNYFFNGGFLMPAKHGGWLDQYNIGGENLATDQSSGKVPLQEPPVQTGSPTGPTFSNQNKKQEDKKNNFISFAMGALGAGAGIGSVSGAFDKTKEVPKKDVNTDSSSPFLVFNTDGNGKPQNLARHGGGVGIYGIRDYNQDVRSNFAIGGSTNNCPPGWKKNEKGECVQDDEARRALAKKVVDIAKQRISSGNYYDVPEEIANTAEAREEGAAGCIGGCTSVLTEAGVMSKPNWSNTDFSKHAREYGFPNKGYGLDKLEYLEPGDILQYYKTGSKNPNKQYPQHAQIFIGINNDGEYEFFDNFWKMKRSYSKEKMTKLFNSENVEKGDEYARVYKVNPWTPPPEFSSPEAQRAFEDRQRKLKSELQYNPEYKYQINPKSYISKNKLDVPEGMQRVIDFGNDNEKVNNLLKSLNKINLGNVAEKAEVHNSIQNVFGILGQENKYGDRWFGGDYGLENTFEKVVAPFDYSVGPGQIKFDQLTPEMKKEFGIDSPRDLSNWDKVIPLMVAKDLENKNWMKNQGENLGLRITGQPGSYENLPQDYSYYSPYFWRGQGLQIKTQAGNAFDKKYNVNDFKSRDEYNAAKNKYVEDNLSQYQKNFDKGSYGRNVQENIRQHLTWDIGNFDRELPQIVIEAPKKEKQSETDYQEGAIEELRRLGQGSDQSQFTHGGDISIPNLEEGNWLNKYK